MKLAALQIHSLHFFIRHLAARRILAPVQAAGHFEALRRRRARNELHDRLVVAQRLAAPIGRDERKQPMFDLVPLARSRREMANGNGQTRFVRQLLQFQFPQPQPPAVAAAAIGRDEQVPRLGIQLAAFGAPPTANGCDGESAGVMVGPHVHESRVAVHVVNAIGVRAGHVGTGKIVTVHLDGLLGGQPLPAAVVVVSQQFLLLGVHGNDGRRLGQGPLDLRVDVAELRVAVGMVLALLGFAVALQAVALLAQQLRDLHVTDRVLLPGQLRGQSPRAFANPAQRRLRIAARFRIDQAVQRDQQMGIVGDDFLSSSPWSPDASGRRRRPLFDFPQALGDGLARQAAGATNLRDAAIAQGAGFAGGHQPPRPLVQERPDRGEFLLELCGGSHAPS